MELSVRCYYVSVRYDKFIKRRFRSLRIAYEDNQAGLLKNNASFRFGFFSLEKFMKARGEFLIKGFSIDYLLQEIIDSRIRIERKCGVGEI